MDKFDKAFDEALLNTQMGSNLLEEKMPEQGRNCDGLS